MSTSSQDNPSLLPETALSNIHFFKLSLASNLVASFELASDATSGVYIPKPLGSTNQLLTPPDTELSLNVDIFALRSLIIVSCPDGG